MAGQSGPMLKVPSTVNVAVPHGANMLAARPSSSGENSQATASTYASDSVAQATPSSTPSLTSPSSTDGGVEEDPEIADLEDLEPELVMEAEEVAPGLKLELVEGDFTADEMFELLLGGKLPRQLSSERNSMSAVTREYSPSLS